MDRTDERAGAGDGPGGPGPIPGDAGAARVRARRLAGPAPGGDGPGLDAVIDAVIEDWRGSLAAAAAALGVPSGACGDRHARAWADTAIWEGDKIVAVVRGVVGGPPEVMRFAPSERAVPPKPFVEVDRGGDDRAAGGCGRPPR